MALIVDNDDCLMHILEYLPTDELWSIIHASPNILRNRQLYRCVWATLRKCGAPFTLVTRFRGFGGDLISLQDRNQQLISTVRRADSFCDSPFQGLVEKVEIGYFLNLNMRSAASAALPAVRIDARWQDLILTLPHVNSLKLLSLFTHYATPEVGVLLPEFAVAIAPIFPRLASVEFDKGGKAYPPEANAVFCSMLAQMTGLRSVKIPCWLRRIVAERHPDLADRLRGLYARLKLRAWRLML